MSFFDEADEPRTASRPAPRRRPPSGGARRPPGGGARRPPGTDPQAIRVRRLVAIGVLAVVLILVIVGVHSCQVSARNSALKDYNSNVVALIQQSNATGRQFFTVLTSGASPHSLQTSLNEARQSAASQLSHAQGLSVPDEVKKAQQDLVLALTMRRDGIRNVGQNIQQALSKATSKDAINAIAAENARLYASDAVYKDYALPFALGALKAAGIAVGGVDGQQIASGQFVPDIRWLEPAFVAQQLRVSLPAATKGKLAPGLHGHTLNSVSVAGTTLQTGSTNTIPASPAPTFTLNFSNTGQNNETNVACKVTVSNTSISGQTNVPQTSPGQQTTCDVPLSAAPPRGSYTVTATIVPVPGEKNASNNTLRLPVSFQ